MNRSTIECVKILLKKLTAVNAFSSLEALCTICKPDKDAQWVLEKAEKIQQARQLILSDFAAQKEQPDDMAKTMFKAKWDVYALIQNILIHASCKEGEPLAELRRKAEPIYQDGVSSIQDTLAGIKADLAMLEIDNLDEEQRKEKEQEIYTRYADYREVLFAYFATCDIWDSEVFDEMTKVLYTQTVDGITQAIIVSALMLANFHSFDFYKWVLVLGIYQCAASPLAKERALLAIVVTAMYAPEICMDKLHEVIDKILASDKKFKLDLLVLSKLIVRSKNYEEDGHEVMNTLFKGFLKLTSEVVKQNLKDDGEEEDEIDELLHQADDEEDGEEDNELETYAKELYDMLDSGADIYYRQFKHFAKNDYFQKSTAHWFTPIYIENPVLTPIRKKLHDEAQLEMVINGATMCDVDLYAFLLSLPQDEKTLNEMLSEMMPPDPSEMGDDEYEDEEGEELDDTENPEDAENPDDAEDSDDAENAKVTFRALASALQELYRFFNLGPTRDAFSNPMDEIFFGNPAAPIVSEAFSSENFDKVRLPLARYCLGRKEYDAILSLLEDQETDTEEWHYMLAMAYTHCLEPNLKEAMEHVNWLLKSNPDNYKFNMLCHDVCSAAENYDQALKSIEKMMTLEQGEVDKENLLRLKGDCLSNMGRYDEGVKCYYELYYNHPEEERYTVLLANALISRDLGNREVLDKAYDMVEKVFERKLDIVKLPKPEDIKDISGSEAFELLMNSMQSMLSMDHTWDGFLYKISSFCLWVKKGLKAAMPSMLDMLKSLSRFDRDAFNFINGVDLLELYKADWFEPFGISEQEVDLASDYVYAQYMEFLEDEKKAKREERLKIMSDLKKLRGGMDAEQ